MFSIAKKERHEFESSGVFLFKLDKEIFVTYMSRSARWWLDKTDNDDLFISALILIHCVHLNLQNNVVKCYRAGRTDWIW